jgi:3-deoxy-manno-octulosonate cytidylyltransferase (CMP-KDO synthetase)
MDGPAPRLRIRYRSFIVIPARLASSRLPRKLLLSDTGKPLIQHTYESAQRASRPLGMCVAVDHPDLAHCVRGFGGRVVMTDPQAESGTDRVAEVARQMPDMDVFVNVQGDEPEISGEAIDRAVDTLERHPQADVSTLATPIRDRQQLQDPACVKVVCNRQGEAMYFSRSPIPHARQWDDSLLRADPPCFLQHVGLYAYRRSFLLKLAELPRSPLEQIEKLEQLRVLAAGYKIYVSVIDEPTVGIDTIRDYQAFVSRTRSC